MTIKYQIIFWRDIPAQIKVRGANRQRLSRPLPDRFSVAIDEAAMRAGLTSSDDYLAQWRSSEWQQQEGQPDEVADALVSELDANYHPARLRQLIQQHGLEKKEK
jgi:hypothetical protein